jgi:hypothetical protein
MQTEVLFGLNAWDWMLIVAATWVAVTSLVRLMRLYRDDTSDRMRREVVDAQLRQKREEQQKAGPGPQAA